MWFYAIASSTNPISFRNVQNQNPEPHPQSSKVNAAKKKAFSSIASFLFLKPDSERWICLFLGTWELTNKRLKSNSGQTLWSSENKSRHFLSCQRCFHHPTIFSIEDKLTPIVNTRWREEQKETATLSKGIIDKFESTSTLSVRSIGAPWGRSTSATTFQENPSAMATVTKVMMVDKYYWK